MFVVWIIGALLLLAAAVACALLVHTRRAQRRADVRTGPRYAPTSVDPRGRWQVSRLGPDLLEPAPYVLDTDHDGPTGTPPPPTVRTQPASRPRTERRDRGTE
ncbi:hypothetical protein [Amycolatopsis thermoflava]|uniref:hypothetical protein n=1 Tax=Amycolatopsis thermoflava TaxID=84480 RepID=UPI00366314CD